METESAPLSHHAADSCEFMSSESRHVPKERDGGEERGSHINS